MTRTSEIEALLRAMAERGHWTPEEFKRVEEIVSKDPDDSYLPTDGSRKRRPFEIEGDWGPENTSRGLRLDESRPVPRDEPTPSSVEERLAYLERMTQLVWKVIHDLQGKEAKSNIADDLRKEPR